MTIKQGYLLDTHTLLWFSAGNKTLTNETRNLIENSIRKETLYLASISFWEISMLVAKKKITLNCPTLEWINQATLPLIILPLTAAISVDSCELPDNFHGDPADRIIVATARTEHLVLMTRDNQILEYSKKNHVLTFEI